MLRRPRHNELSILQELHKQVKGEFPFPDIDILSSLYVVVNDEDDIIGYGLLKPIFESTIVLDKTQSMDTKLTALYELIKKGESELSKNGIKHIYAFVQDKKFENLLKKRYNFRPCTGAALVKETK